MSLSPLCGACRALYLRPRPAVRRLEGGLEVRSLFAYDEIEPLLLTKHLPHGWFVYRLLARETVTFYPPGEGCRAVAVDDHPRSGYSHTALLARALKRVGYRPLTGVLRARNPQAYAGRSLAFRQANPRRFYYDGPAGIETVLVDDIVTTGLTLLEAADVLQRSGVSVKGALVLADASRGS